MGNVQCLYNICLFTNTEPQQVASKYIPKASSTHNNPILLSEACLEVARMAFDIEVACLWNDPPGRDLLHSVIATVNASKL